MSELSHTIRLLTRLERALVRVNLGAPFSGSVERRANFVLRRIGAGGSVSLENPSTVRRAIRMIENYGG